MTEDKPQWKETTGLAADSTIVQIICKEEHKEQWTQEATENRYSSRSEYLYELIQEARRYRERGFLSLEDQLTEEPQWHQQETDTDAADDTNTTEMDARVLPPAFIEQHLSSQYQTQQSIVDQIVESDSLEKHIEDAVEDVLYSLADHDVVEYERGNGWRWTQDGAR